MKKAIRFFSLALAILMLVPVFSPLRIRVSATETSPISVMSYNVEIQKDNNDPGTRNTALVPLTVQLWGTDIVGLQEVDSEWNSDLSSLTSGGYSRVQGDTTRHDWAELFYKSTRFNELSSGYKSYSLLGNLYPNVPKNGADPSRDTKNRHFTYALLKDKETGKKILAISTHLHLHHHAGEKGSLEQNALLRNYEIRLMLAWIADQTGYDAVVVLGDMNTDYLSYQGTNTINIFKNEGGFAVTRDSAQSKGDIDGTLVKDSAPGTRNLREQYIFDLILTKGNVVTTYYTVFDNKFDNGGTSYPSDHVPVFSTLIVY